MSKFVWTKRAIEQLVLLTLQRKSTSTIAALLGCHVRTARSMQIELELVQPRVKTNWTKAMVAELKKRYATATAKELEELLGCSTRAIYAKANALNLQKNPEFLREYGRKSAIKNQGRGCFLKGHVPFNKGKKYIAGGRSIETRFQKGHHPHTWRPIGSTRLSKEGYLQRKVTDTGYSPKDYVGVHILLWEEQHGPVPSGYAVCFRDGDKTNIVIDNLELVSRADLLRRNSVHNYPPELFRVIQLNGVLKRRIRELHEKQTDGSL